MSKYLLSIIILLALLNHSCTNKDPFTDAVLNGDVDQVKLFLDKNRDPNQNDSIGRPLLIVATILDNSEMVELLLSHGANPNISFKGDPAIMFSVTQIKCSEKILESLLRAGANPNYTDPADSSTPLLLSAASGNPKCFKMLLKAGADIHAKNIVKANVASKAARSGNVEILSEILKSDVDINNRTIQKGTPLMSAAYEGHREFVQMLLDTGKIDVCAKNKRNETAAVLAAKKGHMEISRLLSICK